MWSKSSRRKKRTKWEKLRKSFLKEDFLKNSVQKDNRVDKEETVHFACTDTKKSEHPAEDSAEQERRQTDKENILIQEKGAQTEHLPQTSPVTVQLPEDNALLIATPEEDAVSQPIETMAEEEKCINPGESVCRENGNIPKTVESECRAVLEKHIIHDNVVYISPDSDDFRSLHEYSCIYDMSVKDLFMKLGYERTLIRPTVFEEAERDMQIRTPKEDADDVEKTFALYPLLGNRIFNEAALDELNAKARTYIERKILANRGVKLSPKAEMQITLALINNAKDWDPDKNSYFWDYILLRFGFRDTDGAVERLLKKSLENSLKCNNRLFAVEPGGRAFKSTVLIHALSTKKSWMTFFDLLFDFYKTNLRWKYIQNDPLVSGLITALQYKMTGETDDEVKISVSTKVYYLH